MLLAMFATKNTHSFMMQMTVSVVHIVGEVEKKKSSFISCGKSFLNVIQIDCFN